MSGLLAGNHDSRRFLVLCCVWAVVVTTFALSLAAPVSAAPSPAALVAQAALDQVCQTLVRAWPATPAAAVPFDEAAIRAAFDPVLVPDPLPSLEPFASARVMDDGTSLFSSVGWDQNANGYLVVEYRGASGAEVCHMRVVVEAMYCILTARPTPGVVLFAGGDLKGGGAHAKIEVEPGSATGGDVAALVAGTIKDPRLAGSGITIFPETALAMEDICPDAIVRGWVSIAESSGRSFGSLSDALSSPIHSVWAGQGGLSGLTVIQVPPGQSVRITLGSALNSRDSPGNLMILGGGDVEFSGTGDFYGSIFTEGAFSKQGTGDFHGIVLCGSSVSLKGPGRLLYDDLCVPVLHITKTAVRPVLGTEEWLE